MERWGQNFFPNRKIKLPKPRRITLEQDYRNLHRFQDNMKLLATERDQGSRSHVLTAERQLNFLRYIIYEFNLKRRWGKHNRLFIAPTYVHIHT